MNLKGMYGNPVIMNKEHFFLTGILFFQTHLYYLCSMLDL